MGTDSCLTLHRIPCQCNPHYRKGVGSHYIIQEEVGRQGPYKGMAFVLDVYPGGMRVLLETSAITLRQWLSHAPPSDLGVKASWGKFGAGIKIKLTHFLDNLKELIDGMANQHKEQIWPERLAELHSELFGVQVRGSVLGSWQSGAFQWRSYECNLRPEANLNQLGDYCH